MKVALLLFLVAVACADFTAYSWESLNADVTSDIDDFDGPEGNTGIVPPFLRPTGRLTIVKPDGLGDVVVADPRKALVFKLTPNPLNKKAAWILFKDGTLRVRSQGTTFSYVLPSPGAYTLKANLGGLIAEISFAARAAEPETVEIWNNMANFPVGRESIVLFAVKKAAAFRAYQWSIPGTAKRPAKLINDAVAWAYVGKDDTSIELSVRLTPTDPKQPAKTITVKAERPTTTADRKRWNIFEMPQSARDSYFTAAECVKKLGIWDFLVKAHLDVSSARRMGEITTDAHGSPAFPVWHRLFVELYERSLLACGLEAGAGSPWMRPELMKSVDNQCLFQNTMFGNRAGRVTQGFMDDWVGYGDDHIGVGNERIVRSPPGRLYDIKADVRRWKASLDAAVNDKTKCPGFTPMRSLLEGIHNMAHVNIGGDMGAMASPNDPLFYLVHTRTEKQYTEWQLTCPAIANSYNGQNRMGDVAQKTDLLDPWKIPVEGWLAVPSFVKYSDTCGTQCMQCEGADV